jgi:hypothetical protein
MSAYMLIGFHILSICKSKSAILFAGGLDEMGTCTFIEDQGIIEIVYSDEITEEELISDRESGAKFIAEKGAKKALVDSRSATLNLSPTAT